MLLFPPGLKVNKKMKTMGLNQTLGGGFNNNECRESQPNLSNEIEI